jgi:cellulose synthase/poly-beta-1,6-N-acetylglucosamine synthase-like glycosyltransferase
MFFFLALGSLFAVGFFFVYSLYFIFVLRTGKKAEYAERLSEIIATSVAPETLPKVTVLVPAYNEEQTIYAKMKNISEFDYPHDRIEVFVLDDCSTDRTGEISERALIDFHLEGRILRNETRMGVNTSYNRALEQVGSPYVLTTDADAVIPPESLLKATKIMLSLEDVGGVAARMIPVHNKTTATTRTAVAYASSYNSMLEAESALSSTFPGSTSCMLMRVAAFSPIPTSYGSSDGNISLAIFRTGFRFIFAPQIEYYEPITENLMEQRRQKIRRATRLIQSTLLNRKIIFNRQYGIFGRTIFPLRLLMMTVCPSLLLLSVVSYLIAAYLFSATVFISVALLLGLVLLLGAKTNTKILNLIASFLIHQVYLVTGLLLSRRKMTVWKKIERRSMVVARALERVYG